MYKNALLINPFGIGDVLFTTPIIHTLKDAFADIRLGYLCNRRTVSILEDNPHIDFIFIYERDEFVEKRKKSVIAWARKSFAFLNQIRQKKFDLAIDFSLNSQYGFFSWYAGIKTRIGYDYKGRGRFLTKKIKLDGYNDKHIVEYYAEILKLINLDLRYRKLELYLNVNDLKWAEGFLCKQGIGADDLLVAIIPGAGASWGKDAYLKHWPAQNFARLCDKIIENYKAKIIILGALSEQKIAQEVKNNMRYEALDLSGKTQTGEFAALLSKVKLAITNDGGPMHMAAALGVKTVSVFGPVDEKVYGPYPPSPNHLVLKRALSCRPCYRNFRFPGCANNRRCIEDISVEEVYQAARSLM